MVQVLGIVGSPRHGGNTSTLVSKALEAAASVGAKTKLIELSEINIGMCKGCYKCTELGHCVIEDDLHIIVDAINESDGIIFGAPGYFGSIPTLMKCMIGRIGRFVSFKGKVGGAMAVGRRSGISMTLQELQFFMYVKEMIIPGIPAWPTGFALNPGDVLGDSDAMSSAQYLGVRVANLAKILKAHPVPWVKDTDEPGFGSSWRFE
ncbi:MAG: flavodoxin family protein [Candidatus Thorarchaeota archaeon]